MGMCHSRKSAQPQTQYMMSEDFLSQENLDTEKKFVDHFNSLQFCAKVHTDSYTIRDMISELLDRIIHKQILNADLILHQIDSINSLNTTRILRSICEHSNSALTVTQKYKEYQQYYFSKYFEVSKDILVVKNLIYKESMQVGLEHLVIVNCLLKKDFHENQIWWNDDYYAPRKNLIKQTFPEIFSPSSMENIQKLQEKQDYSCVQGFSDYLDVLKIRISVSISISESEELSQFISNQLSAQITDAQLDQFYKNMLNALKISKQDLLASNVLSIKRTAADQ